MMCHECNKFFADDIFVQYSTLDDALMGNITAIVKVCEFCIENLNAKYLLYKINNGKHNKFMWFTDREDKYAPY